MIVYCYPKCTTCKKALKYLEEKNIAYEEKNIKENPPKKEELQSWVDKNLVSLSKLWNTSGILYRERNLKEKLKEYSISQQLEMLSQEGMLLKRPIVVMEDKVLVGFHEKEWEENLK